MQAGQEENVKRAGRDFSEVICAGQQAMGHVVVVGRIGVGQGHIRRRVDREVETVLQDFIRHAQPDPGCQRPDQRADHEIGPARIGFEKRRQAEG
jgi:hypothetical protein